MVMTKHETRNEAKNYLREHSFLSLKSVRSSSMSTILLNFVHHCIFVAK